MNKPLFPGANIFLAALLVVLVAAVFWEAPEAAFLAHHDDNVYVTNNPHVKEGLTANGIAWAFGRSHGANWHPLTWISHQIDVECHGLEPRGHHLTSLVLHALNTVLLFFLLFRVTGAGLRGGFVAALFAVHPLHVESVAWVAERKDVLSAFFLLLAIFAYVGYTRRPGLMRYLAVALLFSLGLMAKPMVVTFPVGLLLLDYWPLRRFVPAMGMGRLIAEKLPLLALSAASSVVTMIAQAEGGAMRSLPLVQRVSNALVAYVTYIVKMIWPRGLAAQYPHPEGTLPWWQIIGAALCLIVMTLLAVRFGKRYRYLPAGWLWFLGTLVPVIGIVQVGHQAMADRYTYIPLIGLFVIVAWGAHDLAARAVPSRRARTVLLWSLAALVLAGSSVAARVQVGYWKDGPTLFGHAIAVTEENYLAEHDLGMSLLLAGDVEGGIEHLERSIAIKPDFGVTYANLAMIHFYCGRPAEAWKNVHLARQYDCELAESFMSDLKALLPDPGR